VAAYGGGFRSWKKDAPASGTAATETLGVWSAADDAATQCHPIFCGIEQLKEDCTAMPGVNALVLVPRCQRHSPRSCARLRKSPWFTITAILLFPRIGAKHRYFQLLDSVLLRSLPVSDPRAGHDSVNGETTICINAVVTSNPPMPLEQFATPQGFSQCIAWTNWGFQLVRTQASDARGLWVTRNVRGTGSDSGHRPAAQCEDDQPVLGTRE